jgi:hypothetical protein
MLFSSRPPRDTAQIQRDLAIDKWHIASAPRFSPYLFCCISPLATLEAGNSFIIISDPTLTELALRFFVDDGNGVNR